MSFDTKFMFAAGLKTAIRAPNGTLDRWKATVLETERALDLKRETWQGQERWVSTSNVPAEVTDEAYCEAAEKHNCFVAWLHDCMGEWQEKPGDGYETILPEDVNGFWFDALQVIDVPTERWTDDYYRARMDALYDTLRGRPAEGMHFDSDALTVSQAKDVIILLAQWLDRGDIRLDVPKGHDALYASNDGGYDWCPSEGAIHHDETEAHGWSCTEEECDIWMYFEYEPDDEDWIGCPPSERVWESMDGRAEQE